MEEFFHSVYLDKELCKGCINCIKRCPTEAIRVRNGKAQINNKFCIDCGECIKMCSNHAKRAARDSIDILENYEYTVALPAPALYSQFNNIYDLNVILTALILLGFDDVYEVSGAAEIVSEASRNYMENNKDKWPIISSACPTIVRLIRVRFPSLIKHLLPIRPPVEIAAQLAVHRAMKKTGLPREKIGVIFISPCPAKVTYAKMPLGISQSEINGVIAIKDIYPLLLAKLSEVGDDVMDLSSSGRIGIGWGCSGGEASGIITDNYLAADGIENVIRVLEDLEDEKFTNLDFIELNSCNGGCVGGVLTVENAYIAHAKNKSIRKYLPVSVSRMAKIHDPDLKLEWTDEIEFKNVFQIGNSVKESIANLNSVERICNLFPGLDCGSCGAPSCRALAEDIVRGEASDKDCIHIFKEYFNFLSLKLSNLSQTTISTPNDASNTVLDLEKSINQYFDSVDDKEYMQSDDPEHNKDNT